jgi:hypothetical protein
VICSHSKEAENLVTKAKVIMALGRETTIIQAETMETVMAILETASTTTAGARTALLITGTMVKVIMAKEMEITGTKEMARVMAIKVSYE